MGEEGDGGVDDVVRSKQDPEQDTAPYLLNGKEGLAQGRFMKIRPFHLYPSFNTSTYRNQLTTELRYWRPTLQYIDL